VYAILLFVDQPHVERHLNSAWQSGSRIVDSAIALLPNLIIAAVILTLFLFMASASKSIVRRISERRKRGRSLGVLLGQLAQVTVIVFGCLVAFSAISITGLAGRVEDIQTRATVVRTSQGQRIVIPNAVLFTSPVIVGQTTPKPEPEKSQETKEEVREHAGSVA
jgi:small conductance mechanosensitive channel